MTSPAPHPATEEHTPPPSTRLRPVTEEHAPIKEPPQEEAAAPAPTESELEPVYVWDLVVRSTHWLIALSMAVLAITGVYIGRPFLISSGEAGDRFVMGTVKLIHYYGAIVFSLAVMARLIWMFTGPKYASWRQFIPLAAKRRRGLVGTFKFYIMLRDKPPMAAGHNPLAGLTYVAVFGLYMVMIATGFALYSVSAYTSYMQWWDWLLPVFGGPQGARWIHHVVMWLLIGFVVHHFFSALLVSRVEKNGYIDSIFSGYKYLPKDRDEEDDA
jgi:Ni/Fe-hydrogenase 1 B-type cytochrome subunit